MRLCPSTGTDCRGKAFFLTLSPEGVAAHKELAFFNVDRDGLPFGRPPEPAASTRASRRKPPRVKPDAHGVNHLYLGR